MVTERRLAERMESYWSELTPHLGNVVRRLNLSGYEEQFTPLKMTIAPNRMFLVSEIAYSAVASTYPEHCAKDVIGTTAEELAAEIIDRYIHRSERSSHSPTLSAEELEFAFDLAHRMRTYVLAHHRAETVRFGVTLSGHGFLDPAEVDCLSESTLVEFKATERPITSADLRQVLIYLALLHFQKCDLANAEIFNPRRGRSYSLNVADFILSAAGVGPVEFYARCSDLLERLHLEEQR